VQLLFEWLGPVRGLLLVRPERAEVALLGEHALHAGRPDRPGQLVLEVARAGKEPGALELVPVAAAERAQEVPLLPDVVEAGETEVAVRLTEGVSLADVVRAVDAEGLGLADVEIRAPTLDDVFLAKTGRSLEGSEDGSDAADRGEPEPEEEPIRAIVQR